MSKEERTKSKKVHAKEFDSDEEFQKLKQGLINDIEQIKKDKKRDLKQKLKEELDDLSASEKEEGKERSITPSKDKEGTTFFDLNAKKKVFIKKFGGRKMVDIREVYDNDKGEMCYTKKGVCLTEDAWVMLKKLLPSIDNELSKLK